MKKLYIIGLGPGGGRDLTGRAAEALEASDVPTGWKKVNVTNVSVIQQNANHPLAGQTLDFTVTLVGFGK